MNVYELNEYDNNINFKYIETGISNYIRNTNYPKKLVLNNILTDINKRKELEKKLKNKINQINEEINKMNSSIESLKFDNNKKINMLLTNFSSNVF